MFLTSHFQEAETPSLKNEYELVLGNRDRLTRGLPAKIISHIFTFSLYDRSS